jgi:hypothetical protein
VVGSIFIVWLLSAVLGGHLSLATADSGKREVRTATGDAYRLGPGDTPEIARALALYGAKFKAVPGLAHQLAGEGVVKDYAERQLEIYCLLADSLTYTIIDESFSRNDRIYSVDIVSRGSLADFVKAEIKNAELEKSEMTFTWQEEMDPVLSTTLEPGQELSRAYRYIRCRQWRKAIIYLDHLEKKYPNWSDLFVAKASGFEGMHEMRQAQRAHAKACELGHRQACIKVTSLTPED